MMKRVDIRAIQRAPILREAEILDVDEEGRRQGMIAGRLRGTLM